MDRLVRAFPLLPGRREAFHAFVRELGERHAETRQFYEGYGITGESWHLQETPSGDMIIVCTDIQDLAGAAPRYARSQAPFETWFKARVLECCGVDANRLPKGPPAAPVFQWPMSAQGKNPREAASGS